MSGDRERTILILTEFWFPQFGGSITHVEQIARKLVSHCGALVVIVARRTKASSPARPDFSGFEDRISVIEVGMRTGYENPLGLISWFLSSLYQLFILDYDLIYAQAYLTAFPALVARRIRPMPLVYRMAGVRIWIRRQLGEPAAVVRMKNALEVLLVHKNRSYDHVISSDSKVLDVPGVADRISVIPNGVDIEVFDAVHVDKAPFPTLVYTGRIHREKNVSLLIRVMAELDDCAVRLKIVGDGDEREQTEALAKRLGVADRVEFRGRVDYGEPLWRELKSSHVFVLPSLTEGQPLSLLQAWAARLPVVVTDVGDNAHFVLDGQNGFLVASDDVGAMARAIRKVLEMDETAREEIGLAGYRLVRDSYSWDMTAARVWDVFEGCWRDECDE